MILVTYKREIVFCYPTKGMEVFMRKGCKIGLIFLIMTAIAGCSAGSKESTVMDFQAQMDWKIPEPAVGSNPRILFVGNSHTFYNNLPGTFVNIAHSLGHKSDVYELAQGYYTLEQYANPEDEAGALLDKTVSGKKWDFVILQENTSVVLSDSVDEKMYPYARVLDEKVKSAGGQTAFLMTWAPKDGLKEGFKTYSREQLQSTMAENYMTITNELNGLLIPAGISFMRCMEEYPEVELWAPDGYHPSPEGTYLAACTAYALVYQESPENCLYIGELDIELAHKLQKIAAELVLGDGGSETVKNPGNNQSIAYQ